ncbi:MAG: nucleotide-binding protein, partial [Acidobacteria bacterium]|nr:nucleotide-binding protein [Acidobacteriota bacterium]
MTQQPDAPIKPKVFIGSSTSGLDVAYEIQAQLAKEADLTVWDQEDWLGRSTLQHLIGILNNYDFAILVFQPDDMIQIKGQELTAIRDNVLFELGLFMGKHGAEKTFIFFQDSPNVRIPSDLLGINFASYTPDSKSDLTAACTKIRGRIRQVWAAEQQRALAEAQRKAEEEERKKYAANEIEPLLHEAGMLVQILNAATWPQYGHIDSELLRPLKAVGVESFARIEHVRKIAGGLFRYYMFPYSARRHAADQRLRVYFAYYLGDGAPFESGADPNYCLGEDEDGKQFKGEFVIGISNPRPVPEPHWLSGVPLKGYERGEVIRSGSNAAEAFRTRDSQLIEDTEETIPGYLNFKVEDERTVYSAPVLFSSKWHEDDWRAPIGVLTVSGSHPGMISPDIVTRADH